MNDEKLKRANDLRESILVCKGKIRNIEKYFETGKNTHEFSFSYYTDESSTIVNQVAFSTYKTEDKAVINVCADMVAGYMLEVLKAKLIKLEEEYKNL